MYFNPVLLSSSSSSASSSSSSSFLLFFPPITIITHHPKSVHTTFSACRISRAWSSFQHCCAIIGFTLRQELSGSGTNHPRDSKTNPRLTVRKRDKSNWVVQESICVWTSSPEGTEDWSPEVKHLSAGVETCVPYISLLFSSAEVLIVSFSADCLCL